jgi:hypothetical protein
MNKRLRYFFSFILKPLEKGSEPIQVNPLNRKVLIVMGCLFFVLGAGSLTAFLMLEISDKTYLFPAAVFFIVAILCLIVGCLGNDRAVAKIWGSSNR